MYFYSDMECLHRHNFLPFQVIFCFFAPLLTPKFGKFIKKHLDILSFYTCVPLIKIIWCMVPEIWSSTDAIFLPSWAIFCPFTPPNTLKNEIIKNEKSPGDIIILRECTKNHDHLLYCSKDMTHDGYNCYFHFGLSGIFPTTFVQPVNSCKNSILNWVIKLNLIKLPVKMCRLCFCSQRECQK